MAEIVSQFLDDKIAPEQSSNA